jgi:F-type H+-transporting ATPase subunit gamma
MAGTKEIKRRIKSIKNTKKITKAMELVASSKMKRAVSNTVSSRLYAEYSWQVLLSLSLNLEEIKHRFFEENESDKVLLVLITSNRGLCGSYNSQVIKKALNFIKNEKNVDILSIGKKGDLAMRRIGANIIASFVEIPDILKLNDIKALSDFILSLYKDKKYKKINIVYTDFVSALTQKSKIKVLLPIKKEEVRDTIDGLGENLRIESDILKQNYIFEGNIDSLIESISEKIIRMQIYQMLLESNASEQSSRMVAMKNASEAAGEMIDDLTLIFNKARQSGITQEISEISAGMASIE